MRSHRGVAANVTLFPSLFGLTSVCFDQSDSMPNVATGGAGVLRQSKSVSLTCVLVHVMLPLVSWHCQNCELCSLRGIFNVLYLSVWSALSSLTVGADVAVGVIIRQCLPHEKQAFQYVARLVFFFSSSWIYSKANVRVKCQSKCFQGLLLPIFTFHTAKEDPRPRLCAHSHQIHWHFYAKIRSHICILLTKDPDVSYLSIIKSCDFFFFVFLHVSYFVYLS